MSAATHSLPSVESDSVPSASTSMVSLLEPVRIMECETCTKNTSTVNTMLTVMQQQAATIRDQQATISNLLAVLGNIEQTPKNAPRNSASPAKPVGKKIVSISKKARKAPTVTGSVVRGRGRPRKNLTGLPTRERSIEIEDVDYEPVEENHVHQDIHHDSVAPDDDTYLENLGMGGDDTVEVTKIWIRGNADPKDKTPCPLPECANRKFAAADIYYLRRHFQQVHRLTHPNPIFVIQCPVEDCAEEFDGSYREMRKHMAKEHPDIYSLISPRRSLQKDSEEMEAVDGVEDVPEEAEGVEGEAAEEAAAMEEGEPAEEAAAAEETVSEE
ncbi:uncharacterized protein LOC129594331 [Paramacrobiotus metropolitanus]|uniref:uncharacterized protein LOC129594331 n=1 Tax=Paramacrobiotus metropolitanus TaxID=2943436 RepID=UPI002445F9F7|nr:uncharacterized protein LOC129594331 [Paramacrobiotus metropolitanus]